MQVFVGNRKPSDLQSISEMLTGMGYDVDLEFDSVGKLMKTADKRMPDILVVDVFMGEFPGGFDIGESFRKRGVAVVYVVSESPGIDLVSKYPGCVWLSEPVHGDDLQRAIDDAIDRTENSEKDNLLIMEPLNIIGTQTTPTVRSDVEHQELEIRGTSIPEDASWLYKSITDWIAKYVKTTRNDLKLNIVLEYYNTNTQQAMHVMFDVCSRIAREYKVNIVVGWHYEEDDLDMEEMGEDLQKRLPLGVELVPAERIDFKK